MHTFSNFKLFNKMYVPIELFKIILYLIIYTNLI